MLIVINKTISKSVVNLGIERISRTNENIDKIYLKNLDNLKLQK